jgi:salicylate hydroxylase
MAEPVLIIGGGIGGLTAALALLRQGVPVQVFEQARTIGDVGAGISLGATASKGLYSLGLKDALQAVSDRPQASAARHYQTGEILGGGFKDRQWSAKDLLYTNMVHRADLFTVLLNAVEAIDPHCVTLDRTLVRYRQEADGVTAVFADGSEARGQALIGCDGVRSQVRDGLFGASSPLFTGRIVYRFLVPMDLAAPFMSGGTSSTYVAPGQNFLRYVIRKGAMVNCVTFVTADNWTGEGWSARVGNDELMALFPGWHPDVVGLAANAPLEGTAKWALYDRDPLEVWVQDRVALLGDAAHPMLPFLGLGAAMAIEDAVVLGRAYGQTGDIRSALQLYQSARVGRAGLMLLESRRQGQLFGDGPDSAKPKTVTTHKERMDYDPSTVAL